MNEHHLYAISEGPDGPIKIGRSNNAFARVSQLQTGNPRRLKLTAVWSLPDRETATRAESYLLKELENRALSGEWLDVDEKFILAYMPDFFLADGLDAEKVA